MSEILETKADLLKDLGITDSHTNPTLESYVAAEARYLKDVRMNLSAFNRSKELNKKELNLVALAIANNNSNRVLQDAFAQRAKTEGATEAECAEALACAAALSANNVLYRFRHFLSKESYDKMPAGMRMQMMMNPVLGKEFFELVSLAVSAVNGCEMCVRAHESSLLKLGTSEARIFEAVKLASVVTSLSKVVY